MASAWNKLKKSLSLKLPSSTLSSSSPPSPPPSNGGFGDSNIEYSRSSSASSSSSRLWFSRSKSLRSPKKTCAICLGNLRTGKGQAIFTAECSHSFHFSCIASSVKHGNNVCPICRSQWNDMPFQAPSQPLQGRARITHDSLPADIHPQFPPNFQRRPILQPEPLHFSDDEPLSLLHTQTPPLPPPVLHPQGITVKALPEYPALSFSESSPSFAVLVGVHAPPLPEGASHLGRAPIDLVTVLDVSGSMAGAKLTLLKHAVCFVAQNLGPSDRLSLVTFSSTARRIFPLRRMTDAGREDAIIAINSLSAGGGTSIVQGLKKGVQVLEDRRESNPVASIILLSDGRDNPDFNSSNQHRIVQCTSSSVVQEYLNLLPPSTCLGNHENRNEDQNSIIPVHSFGFGTDHDSTVLHAISDASGGTFSFIESLDSVQDSFARCIGGLLSVVAQQLQIVAKSATHGVHIKAIPSGRYRSRLNDEGKNGTIDVGDLYAGEEKEFLVYLRVPALVINLEEKEEKMSLLDVMCTYKDPMSKEVVNVENIRVEISRPEVVSSAENEVSLEVDRQRNRVSVAEGIGQAQAMAERGNLAGAQALLAERRSTLLSSASAQAGDSLCSCLEAELTEIRERMANMELYEQTGRAYTLSGMSSHSWQRATTRGDWTTITPSSGGASGPISYETDSMTRMITKSQTLNVARASSAAKRQDFTP
ncbi:hypothetical protein Ancab_021550 [Ancistrocladus abbreviatus]